MKSVYINKSKTEYMSARELEMIRITVLGLHFLLVTCLLSGINYLLTVVLVVAQYRLIPALFKGCGCIMLHGVSAGDRDNVGNPVQLFCLPTAPDWDV